MTQARRHVRPSVNEIFRAFPGHIYRPVIGAEAVHLLPSMGWGGVPPAISSLSLQYAVGRRREEIRIEVRQPRPGGRWNVGLLFTLLEPAERAGFPIVINRDKQPILVEGRERVFTIYTAANAAVAVTRVGGLELSVECRRSRLATLELQLLDADALRHVMPTRTT